MKFCLESLKGRDHSVDLDIGGKMLLKIDRSEIVLVSAFIWLMIGASGRLL
jgi:hypothetical protein